MNRQVRQTDGQKDTSNIIEGGDLVQIVAYKIKMQ